MNRGLIITVALLAVAGIALLAIDRDSTPPQMSDTSSSPPQETAMPTSSPADWATAQTAFMAENIKQSGWQAMDNGMQYKVLTAVDGDGVKPAPGSDVTVHYEGRLIDGKVFDSSYARNEPASFPLSGVIRGWQDGVPMMKVGETWEFAIPANLAYGDRGVGPIPGGSTLIFKIELLEADTPAK